MIVARGCVDVRAVAHVMETRCFPDRNAFALPCAEAVWTLVDRLASGDVGAAVMGVAPLRQWCREYASRDGPALRALAAMAALLDAHVDALRGRWGHRDELTALLGEAAWRDVAASALAAFPEALAAPKTMVWPDVHPLPIKPALLRHADVPAGIVDDFAAMRARGEPFVMRGLAVQWPALQRWRDPEHLRAVIGHTMLPIEVMRVGVGVAALG